ncbi:hypothetical protein BOTCAL_0993g00020 [Botryotinia calthae]|uniref:Uncharacterized protein n=1 Tax=Botryotinia calthae TaxID=38488 RepID=A0A4Y8CG11_9HELO|nr:hypothetical protein BOTCAL_0993g00020 [Botryotinia calthae]
MAIGKALALDVLLLNQSDEAEHNNSRNNIERSGPIVPRAERPLAFNTSILYKVAMAKPPLFPEHHMAAGTEYQDEHLQESSTRRKMK